MSGQAAWHRRTYQKVNTMSSEIKERESDEPKTALGEDREGDVRVERIGQYIEESLAPEQASPDCKFCLSSRRGR